MTLPDAVPPAGIVNTMDLQHPCVPFADASVCIGKAGCMHLSSVVDAALLEGHRGTDVRAAAIALPAHDFSADCGRGAACGFSLHIRPLTKPRAP